MSFFLDFINYLPSDSLFFLAFGFLLLISTSFFILKSPKSDHVAFKWLLLAGFILFGIGFGLIDPFLNEWDEQFHALVAKNLAENPFKPVLIKNTPVELKYTTWAYCHIWMHKQPLFMWQMALSIKTFGPTLFAARLPSVILHAGTAVLLFSIAGRFLMRPLALLACLLFGLSGYFNDYTSGAIGMDHNDVAFVFYITLSFWCWLKYRENRSELKWQVAIGMAVGAAILCKWLVGLLVFSGWGLVVLIENYKHAEEWKNMLRTFLVTCIVAVPWQIYCYVQFNREYVYEMNYNSKHLSEAIEVHAHDYFFYWETMKQSYGGGEVIRWLIVLGIVLLIISAIRKNEKWKLFVPFVYLIAFAFFTVAQTKLQGYMTIVAPLGFIFLLYPVQQLIRHSRLANRKLPAFAITLLFVPVLYFQFGFKQVVDQHKFRSPEVRLARFHKTKKALKFIRENPLKNAQGYYLLDDHEANILCSIVFFTDKNVLDYSESLEKKLNQKGISYRIIQY